MSMERAARRIAITGMGSFTGPAIASSLRATCPGLELWGLDARLDTEGLVLCDHVRRIPMAGEGLVEALKALVAAEGIDVLIPALDSELQVLAVHREAFAALGCVLLMGGLPFVQLCRSKVATADHFRRRGLPFAQTWRCIPDTDPEALVYPLLVKPDDGAGGKGQRIVQDARQWRRELGQLEGCVAQPLLQALDSPAEGRAWNQPEFVAQTVHDADGHQAGLFLGISRKRCGVSWSLAPFRDGAVEAAVTAMVAALVPLGLRGPCNFQGILTAEGPVFFELNPRFTGGTAMRTALGFQEVRACLALLAGHAPVESVEPMLRTGVEGMVLRTSALQVVPRSLMAE